MQKISAVDDRFIIFSIFKGRIVLKSDISPFSEPKSGHIICPKAAEYIDRCFFQMNVANQDVCPLTFSIVRVLYLHIFLETKSQYLHISLRQVVKCTHECSHEYHTISAFMTRALAQLKEIYPMLLYECIAECIYTCI